MSEPAHEPLDEQAYLQSLDWLQCVTNTTTQLGRFLHQTRRLHAELIRLRNAERVARERLSLLEQGQTLLPLPPTTLTNQPAAPLP